MFLCFNIYKKTINVLSKSFKNKHEKLIKEENDIKEKFKNEITKTKEKLENYFSILYNAIKINENINQGIKNINKDEKEANIIKNISYVSKMNKTKKQINEFFNLSLNNLKFEYKENQNNIIYEEYCFNTPIPIPKNIEFKDIYATSLNLSWEYEGMNNVKTINYKVEMRKKDEDFILVYKGKNKNCTVNNLNLKTDYEFRICSCFSGFHSSWTKIQKITTNDYFNCNSTILEGLERKNYFLSQIYEWSGYKKMELLYRGTKDGPDSSIFHNKCDDQGPTITLYKNDKDNIFGGYCPVSWKSGTGEYINAPKTFLFTLTNIYNTEPKKFETQNTQYEITYNTDLGPSFGAGKDLLINKNYANDGGYSNFPKTFKDISRKGKSIFTGNLKNDIDNFRLKEIEVFKLSK